MKFATAWWGVQFLAETDSDKEILSSLIKTLPEKCEKSYDAGTMKVLNPEDCDDTCGFDGDEIKNSKLCVEFNC